MARAQVFILTLLLPVLFLSPARSMPARTCDAQRLGPIDFELCEAKRLDEAAAALRARAAGADVLARQRNPNCDDDDGDKPIKPSCDASNETSGPLGAIRAQAKALEAEADGHRATADALRRGAKPAAK